jgi:hypothetical protein
MINKLCSNTSLLEIGNHTYTKRENEKEERQEIDKELCILLFNLIKNNFFTCVFIGYK